MGLFSDRCEAFVDPVTRRALQGDLLNFARTNPNAERCGNKVPKAARFCNKCGCSAPGGWWKCHSCGKWVGAEANFCWNCKTALHPENRNSVSDGVWQREPGVFARRVQVAEMRRLLERGLQVETGTVALLLEGGAIKSVLEPGRHTLDTMKRKLLGLFVFQDPQAVLLVDAGDIVLPLRFTGLRTNEEMAVECYTEVCFRFAPARGEDFIANILKEKEHLSLEGLADWMRQEIRGAVVDLTNASSMQDLVKDPQRRKRIEDSLRGALATALSRAGVELVRVASVEFTGAEYEELRAAAGQIEVKRREIEFQQRLRELTNGAEMDRFKDEQELSEYVLQLAQEKSISADLRDHELARLKQVQRHELEKGEVAYRMACEIEAAAHQIQIKIQWDDHTRERLLKDAEVQSKVKAIAADEEVRQSFEWLKVRAEKQRIEVETERARAQTYAGQDFKTLIALLPDGKQRAELLELFRQTTAANQTPEQILAGAAGASSAAAEALTRIREIKREDLEREFRERKALSDESAARLERVLMEAMRAMSAVGQARGEGTVTVNNNNS
jgi:hypothetical protein